MKRFLILTVFICLMLVNATAQVNTQDSLGLVNIYNSTNGNGWVHKWIRTQPVSTWFGVTVTNGRVTAISLPGNNLTGKLLSSNITKLTKLKVLQLQNNHISGALPAGIGTLTDMELLDVSFNDLSGNIVAAFFDNLPNLKKFNVANNSLKGWIPANIANSTALTEINLSNNTFSNKIPASINNLTNLTRFLAANNQLYGAIPAGKLCSASVEVDVSGNYFTFSGMECLGSNPNAVYNNQRNLELTQNNLKLSVAAGGTLANNTYTWFRNNNTTPYFVATGNNKLNVVGTGHYSVKITNSAAPGLTLYSDTVSLTVNSFASDSLALVDIYNDITSGLNWVLTNPVSTWEGVRLEGGRVVELYIGNLTGTLSPSIGNLPELKYLSFNEGSLTGNLPAGIANLTKIEELHIYANNFTGSIPDDMGRNQQQLYWLLIEGNPLTGTIPSGLRYATNLGELYITGTQIGGTIPTFFREIPLFNVNLSENQLTGPIPDTLSSEEGMGSIVLHHNQLTGGIHKWMKTRAVSINLSYNNLSGQLPDSIGDYGAWVTLNNNQFTGEIPLVTGTDLELDLSNNLLESVKSSNCGATMPYPSKMNFSGNRLNFSGLECLQSITGLEELIITPQAKLPIINENPVLKAAAGGTLANNTYKWYKNAALLATNTGDSTLIITTPGLYYCIVTNSNVPGVELRTDSASISTVSSRKVQGLVDEANAAYAGKLTVYPNPAGDFIYIKGLQKAESVLLYNASGQLVKQWQNVNGNQQLNVGEIANGIYMVKIIEKDKQTTLNFIKK